MSYKNPFRKTFCQRFLRKFLQGLTNNFPLTTFQKHLVKIFLKNFVMSYKKPPLTWGVDIFRNCGIIVVMSVQKYNLYMGKYDELLEHFSFVFEKYEGKNTPYFDMPSEGIKKQFESILKERVNMGVINYCKAIKHRKDPLVEVKTEFVYIEDMLQVADGKNSTSCGNTTRCSNTANITPEELFGDDFKNL